MQGSRRIKQQSDGNLLQLGNEMNLVTATQSLVVNEI